MFSDGSSFFKRAVIFQSELKKGSYPNSTALAKLAGCSKNTAQRTIDRLRGDYALPLAYDKSRHGYYLLDLAFELPTLAIGKDELTALLLMRDLARVIDASDLHDKIDSLWQQYAATHASVVGELEKLAQFFSSDLTVVSKLSGQGLFDLLYAASRASLCEIRYKSPWRHTEEKVYRGSIAHLRFSDGTLYMLFSSRDGRSLVLNTAYLRNLTIIDSRPASASKQEAPKPSFESFGIWRDDDVVDIEIRILPPASSYYATQVWHRKQKDVWEGEVLVRKMKASLSPEIVKRILSLGSFLGEVRPAALKEMAAVEARALASALGE